MGLRVEDRRVAVGVGEGLREILGTQPLHLFEHVTSGVDVHLSERTAAERLVGAEDFKEIEFKIAKIALVMPHQCEPSAGGGETAKRTRR